MFFILSKLLTFLIKPFFWIVLCFFLGILVKNQQRKRRLLWLAFVGLLLFTNRGLFQSIMRWWELPAVKIEQTYDIGIILGGYSNQYGYPKDGRQHFGPAANRFIQGLELYHRGKLKKVMLSGGNANWFSPGPNESRVTFGYLRDLGLPQEAILLEDKSRNTYENAMFCVASIQKEAPQAKVLLITSAWHMYRARACFRKAGLRCDWYCSDYLQNKQGLSSWAKFEPGNLEKWDLLIKEWVGLAVYAMKGYL
jgi:uncharacterized SAM-binding protein YcdF (DUF218 family)